MDIVTTNQKQIELIKAYMQDETGRPYDNISEEEKNRLSLEWVRRHAAYFRQRLLTGPKTTGE